MLERHEQLKKLGDEARQQEIDQTSAETNIQQLISQNALLKPEVERYQERERQAKQLHGLKQKIPWAKYETSRLKWLHFNDLAAAKQQELNALEKDSGPTEDALQKAKDQAKAANHSTATSKQDGAALENNRVSATKKVNRLDERLHEHSGALTQAKRDNTKYGKHLGGEDRVADLENKLAACSDKSV